MALNNSESEKTAAIPTYVKNGSFQRVYGTGEQYLTSNASRRLSVTVPALSAVVYKSVKPIASSKAAPRISLAKPKPSVETNSRMLVSAGVSGSSFNEVTFYAKVGGGGWKSIGTDDTRPYRVFHDVSAIKDGRTVAYRAVVRDNAGHKRLSSVKRAVVPAPKLTIKTPAEGASVFGTIEVRVLADPERATHKVRIQRKLPGGRWTTVRTDTSSPIYTYLDPVSELPVGTVIRYRAVLDEPDGTRVISDVRTVTRTVPKPSVNSVTIAGDLQSEAGCASGLEPGLRSDSPDLLPGGADRGVASHVHPAGRHVQLQGRDQRRLDGELRR